MTSQNFTTTFVVDQTPDEAFAAITNVRGWWSGEIEGPTDKLGGEFTYRYQDVHYTKQRISELVPGHKVTWQIVDAYLSFTEDPNEWTGTNVTFEILPQGDQTEVRFSTSAWSPSSSATTSARAPGASTSTAASSASSRREWASPTRQRRRPLEAGPSAQSRVIVANQAGTPLSMNVV